MAGRVVLLGGVGAGAEALRGGVYGQQDGGPAIPQCACALPLVVREGLQVDTFETTNGLKGIMECTFSRS